MPLNQLLKDKNQKIMAMGLSFILILVLGYWLGILVWQVVDNQPDKQTVSLVQIFTNKNSVKSGQQAIAPLHLFGQAKQQKVVRRIKKTTNAPISRLNLTLNGVFASTPADSALAIISSGKRDELLYAVGESLPGGAVLKEVYDDKVIIERNGSLETLLLSVETANIKTNDAEPVSEAEVFHSTPKELRVKLLKDPSQIPKIIATVPEYKNGKIIGYKLKMKKYKGILQQYGLQKNDVVTKINGIDITNKANAFKLLQQLTNSANLDLEVLRNGTKASLSISLM